MEVSQVIIQSLNTIEPTRFQNLVDFLLYQKAFPEILSDRALINSFGVNLEKNRTIKSFPFTDSEIKSLGLCIECSTRERWQSKLKEDVDKNKGKNIKTFVFASNRDLGNRKIRVGKKDIFVEEYCKEEIKCNEVFIIDQKNLLKPLSSPDFFHIRRNYLDMKDDLFINYENYQKTLQDKIFLINDQKITQNDINRLESDIFINDSDFLLIHCPNLNFILHLIGVIAQKNFEEQKRNRILQRDFAFIRWPRQNIDFNNYLHEIKNISENYIIIWNAHMISKDLINYLEFKTESNKLVFITDEINKDEIINFFERNGLSLDIISFKKDFARAKKISLVKHKDKLNDIFTELEKVALQLESLIYFFSPFYENNLDFRQCIKKYLGISQLEEEFIIHKLVKNKILYRTGNILWLRNINIGKKILKSLIDNGIFKIGELIGLKDYET